MRRIELKQIIREVIEESKTIKSNGNFLKEEGVGYELYAKGLDRITKQCETISSAAANLSKAVRENKVTLTTKKKKLKELEKWIDVLNKEMEGVSSDLSNLEGYDK